LKSNRFQLILFELNNNQSLTTVTNLFLKQRQLKVSKMAPRLMLISVVLAIIFASAYAQLGGVECPPKTGEVYTFGNLGNANRFYAVWLAAEHAVNMNALANKPSVGCFDFNMTFFSGDGVASDEQTCLSDPDYPFLDKEAEAMGCPDLCFPVNALRFDTDCKADRGAPGAQFLMSAAPDLMGTVGAGCSGPTIEAANTFEEAGLPLISPSATSARLSSIDDHPNFFRTCPGDAGQSKALVDIAQGFGITKAAVIATPDPYSKGFADGIIEFMPGAGIELTTYQLVGEDTDTSDEAEVEAAIAAIKDSGAKLIFVTAHCDNSRKFKTYGEQYGMTADNCYMWMGGDGNTRDGCIPTEESNPNFLGNVGTNPRGGSGDIYLDLMGFWAEQDECAFPSQIHTEGVQSLENYATEAYDAVLAYAMAIKRIKAAGMEVTPAAIIEELDKDDFQFQGATGIVSFGGEFDPPIGDHDRPPIYDIEAYEGKWIQVGYWSPLDLETVNIFFPIVFAGGVFEPPACLNE
jgi:ABC-type branched-subunit amino acid transport system substrate-binding protein